MFKKLLGNKIILEKKEEKKQEEKKTAGGLYIPQTQKKQSLHENGKVIQVGPDCEVVSEGDTVMYDKMAVRIVEIDGKDYILLNEESIIGVL